MRQEPIRHRQSGGSFTTAGVAFKISTSGVKTALHVFQGCEGRFQSTGFLVWDTGRESLRHDLRGRRLPAPERSSRLKERPRPSSTASTGRGDGASLGWVGDRRGRESFRHDLRRRSELRTARLSNFFRLRSIGWEVDGEVLYSFGTRYRRAVPAGWRQLDASAIFTVRLPPGGLRIWHGVSVDPGTPWTENQLHDFFRTAMMGVPYAGLVATPRQLFRCREPKRQQRRRNNFPTDPSNGTWNFQRHFQRAWLGNPGVSATFAVDPSSGNLYATHSLRRKLQLPGTVLLNLTPSGGTWDYNLLYTFTGRQRRAVFVQQPSVGIRGNSTERRSYGGT